MENAKPKRIQRKRTKGWKMPPGAVYVGRPTKWGNNYRIGSDLQQATGSVRELACLDGEPHETIVTPEIAVRLYEAWLYARWGMLTEYKVAEELHGKDLVCWCSLDAPCHADVLLRLANE